MTEQALPPPARFPWLAPALIFTFVLAALVGVVLFAREAGEPDQPPQPGAFELPPGLPYAAFDVERAESGKLTLTSGNAREATTRDLELGAATRVWLLAPATPAELVPPMVVNVISIPNEVRNYTIKLIAAAPAPANVGFEGTFIPLADGFAGHEASRDAKERPVVSAILESFDGRKGVTKTAAGPGTLYVDPGAPIRVLRQGTAGDIQPGDRVALHLDSSGQPDPSRGVLVLTGGAR